MSLADRYLVDADHFGIWLPGTTEFFPHVLLLKFLDCLPVEKELFGYIAD